MKRSSFRSRIINGVQAVAAAACRAQGTTTSFWVSKVCAHNATKFQYTRPNSIGAGAGWLASGRSLAVMVLHEYVLLSNYRIIPLLLYGQRTNWMEVGGSRTGRSLCCFLQVMILLIELEWWSESIQADLLRCNAGQSDNTVKHCGNWQHLMKTVWSDRTCRLG